MKKLLLIGLFLLTACQTATVTPSPSPAPLATATRITPSPVPASPTPTLTPSPTFTPEPPPRYFTEEFDAAPSQWSTLQTSGDASRFNLLNENGALVFELYGSNLWTYAMYGAYTYTDVHLEARIENRGEDANDIGLVCRYDEQAGWYEFNISSDGSYSVLLGQWLAPEIATYTPIWSDTSTRIVPGHEFNEIGLDCAENILWLYVNGKLIRKVNVERYGLQDGKVGISAASFKSLPVILAFDWVKVSEP